MTEHYLHVSFTCVFEADSREAAETQIEDRLEAAFDDSVAASTRFSGPVSEPAHLHPEELAACNVAVPGQRRTLTRHYAAPQIAPRVRWQGREYDYLGVAGLFDVEAAPERHVLCDDDGNVTVAESDLYGGWLLCRCQKCGRWSEDVQEDYGPGQTIVWECPEHCGWQADMDAGKWS